MAGVLDAPAVAQNDVVGLIVRRESVVADSDGGGVKACVELLRNGDIYWTAPSTLRSTLTAPNVSHSLCLRFPHKAHLAREPMLCLHPTMVASALDIIKRLRPEQHSPCNGTGCAYDGRC